MKLKRAICFVLVAFALSVSVKAQERVQEPASRTILAVKSNALYDLGTALNYGIEVPLGTRFSLDWEHTFPWWHIGNKYCLQFLTLDLEFRWWINPSKGALTGHFVGVYGLWGKADLQWGTKGCYQVPSAWSAGLRYGYNFRLSAGWRLELSAAAGFASVDFQHYVPSDDWTMLWQDPSQMGTLSYWGPVNLSVSFVKTIDIKPRKK